MKSYAIILTAVCLALPAVGLGESPTVTETTQAEADIPPVQAEPISMDRSGWPVIVITPADGKVTHHPAFMGDVPMGEDVVSPLHAPDPVWQLQEALRGEEAGNWNGENMTDLGGQPFIALARFAALPFRMILENPWSKDTSPK